MKKLPFYDDYMADAPEVKALTEYRLFGRPTISYLTSCPHISEAVQVLKELETASNASTVMTKYLWVTAMIAIIMSLLVVIPFTIAFVCGGKGKCYPNGGFKVLMIFYSGYHLAFSVALFVMSLIDANQYENLDKSLTEWSGLQSCADSLSQISEDQYDLIKAKTSLATFSLVFSSLALAIHLFQFVS